MTDQAPLTAAKDELRVISMLPVYSPPKPENDEDRYLLRGAVLELVDRALDAIADAERAARAEPFERQALAAMRHVKDWLRDRLVDGTERVSINAILRELNIIFSEPEAARAEPGLRAAADAFIKAWDRVALTAVREGWPAMPQDFGSVADAVKALRAALETHGEPQGEPGRELREVLEAAGQDWYHAAHGLHDEAHHQVHRPMDVCVPLIMVTAEIRAALRGGSGE
jgi:hypothetical protein